MNKINKTNKQKKTPPKGKGECVSSRDSFRPTFRTAGKKLAKIKSIPENLKQQRHILSQYVTKKKKNLENVLLLMNIKTSPLVT